MRVQRYRFGEGEETVEDPRERLKRVLRYADRVKQGKPLFEPGAEDEGLSPRFVPGRETLPAVGVP